MPPTDTSQFALFTSHEFTLAPVRIEAALRWETTAIEARPDWALGNPALAEQTAWGIDAVAQNIFDDTIRRHASFLNDFAPVKGRDFRLRARLAF